jgi:hypothetical protein
MPNTAMATARRLFRKSLPCPHMRYHSRRRHQHLLRLHLATIRRRQVLAGPPPARQRHRPCPRRSMIRCKPHHTRDSNTLADSMERTARARIRTTILPAGIKRHTQLTPRSPLDLSTIRALTRTRSQIARHDRTRKHRRFPRQVLDTHQPEACNGIQQMRLCRAVL